MSTPEMLTTDRASERSILLLEDEDDFREMLKLFLQRAGYRVIGFSSAVDALTVLQRGAQVSLILLDLMMPGVTGFQFRTEQRADAALKDIPVVVLTGGQHPSDYDANLRAVAYLEKPVDLDQILTIVKEHCGPPPARERVM
jgi:two-component system chemotaxis sensor kinase CheA